MTIMNKIKIFLEEKGYLTKDQDFSSQESLIENGILDSIGMMNLVDFIEKEYQVTIDEEDLMPENFDTLEAIDNYVQSLLDK